MLKKEKYYRIKNIRALLVIGTTHDHDINPLTYAFYNHPGQHSFYWDLISEK
jgi:hypothetical protein